MFRRSGFIFVSALIMLLAFTLQIAAQSEPDAPAQRTAAVPSAFTTPGQAFFVSNGMLFVPSNVTSASPSSSVLANQVAVFGFVLPIKITIDHVSIQVSSPVAASTANAGIYNAAGSLLIDSGSFDTSTNTPQYKINTLKKAVVLSPGFYYFAYSLSNETVHLATLSPVDGTSTAANAYSLSFTTTQQPRYGVAANLVTNGGTSTSALPATLGVVTSNENPGIPIVIFEP